MAGSAPAGGYLSTVDFGQVPGQKTNREDLIDTIINVDRTDTPLMSVIGRTTADHTTHEWQQETLRDPAGTPSLISGAVEGADFQADTMTVPTRKQNFCQIFRSDIQLTRSQIKGNPAGIGNMFAHESRKATQENFRAIERRCFAVQPTVAGTQTGNTRLMKTLDDQTASTGMIVSNAVGSVNNIKDIQAAGAAASVLESDFLDVLQAINELGGRTTDIFVSMPIKRRVSKNFVGYGSASAPMSHEVPNNTVIVTFDTYQTDFGTARIVGSVWVTKKNDTVAGVNNGVLSGRVWFLQRDLLKWAWYDELHPELMGKRGDSVAGIVVGEGCIEVRSDKAHGKIKSVDDV